MYGVDTTVERTSSMGERLTSRMYIVLDRAAVVPQQLPNLSP